MTTLVPPQLQTMRAITGTLESPGASDNPVILAWRDEIARRFPDMAAYCANYTHDSIPWCGLTVAYCMAHNGIRPVFGQTDTDKFLWAQAWKQFGTPVDSPQLGDVLVFAHHVTLYDGEDGDHFLCRGGTQSDSVNVTPFAKGGCEAIRRPPPAVSIPTPVFALTAGKGSWYSQFDGKYHWKDDSDEPGSAALGCPDDAQGISFYDHATLGQWFEVHAPNGTVSIEQQTDIGPNPRTGRTIDISAAAAERFGYSPDNFPTNGIFAWRRIDPPKSVAQFSAREQATRYRDLRSTEGTMTDDVQLPAPPASGRDMPPIFDFARWAEIAHALERGATKFAAAADRLAALQAGQAAPPPPPPPAPTPIIQRPSVQLGVAGLGIGSILQALGMVGMPVGEAATQTGLLTTLVPAVVSAIGATGGFGSVLSLGLKLLGGLASAASAAQK